MRVNYLYHKNLQIIKVFGCFLVVFCIITLLPGCNGGNRGLSTDIVQNGKTPKISFSESVHDFGQINEGDIVTYTFDFTNSGDGDLLITDAHAQCSCTVPEWPKDIIKPGEKGNIRIKFDSNGKSGNVTKIVTIEANTNPKISTIRIKANIKETPLK